MKRIHPTFGRIKIPPEIEFQFSDLLLRADRTRKINAYAKKSELMKFVKELKEALLKHVVIIERASFHGKKLGIRLP